jgi:predicted DNA binding CopG/RHH family protein
MVKRLPVFRSDEEAEAFLEQDLSDYIGAETLDSFPYELRPKTKSLNLRISDGLLDAVRSKARQEGIPYQRYIRQALETAVSRPVAPPEKKRRQASR